LKLNFSKAKDDKMTDLVHLQSIGKVEAKPAQEFEIGQFMAWNFGSQSKVVGIAKETKAFITFELLCPDINNDWADAKVYERRLKKTRLVAIGSEEIVKKYNKNYSA
jgi:hypothetical protein